MTDIETETTRQINENAISHSARTTPSTSMGLFVFLGARTNLRGTSGYVLHLGVLVSARGLLHQSKPSIESFYVNTLTRGRNGRRSLFLLALSSGKWVVALECDRGSGDSGRARAVPESPRGTAINSASAHAEIL